MKLEEKPPQDLRPERAITIVPVGTMGKAISLRVQTLKAKAYKVLKQIETPRSSDPITRRPRIDRDEKRVTEGTRRQTDGTA